MKRFHIRLAYAFLVTSMLLCGGARSMTIRLGSEGPEIVRPGDTWRFFRGVSPASEPYDAWTQVDFDDSHWESGPAGFGYGDDDDATVLDDMQGRYVTVYIRKSFAAPPLTDDDMLELAILYDDGFIAYINGREVATRSMPPGARTHTAVALSHEAGAVPERISLGPAKELLHEGQNVLAIEGHNSGLNSSDFSLAPALRVPSSALRSGRRYIVSTGMVTVSGQTEAATAVAVEVGGQTVKLAPKGSWSANVLLTPGMNVVTARALDTGGNEVDSGSVEILYAPPGDRLAGPLTEDLTLSGAYTLDDTVTVPAGRVLTISPGTVLLMKPDVSLVVHGQLLADGTEAEPIYFTHVGDGTAWKQISFVKAADSRFTHCVIEYADSEGAHQDYYEPGARIYHEAVVALACRVDILNCTFQNLPDDEPGAEGDAIAIISDDPQYPGPATADIVGCRFLGIGQGVHTRFSYVRIEDCYFQGKSGDNDDVDLWGESTPPCVIRNNLFDLPEHDDRINPTRCSAIITGNTIMGSDDHGMVLRDKCSPVVTNNIIIGCAAGGIAVENSCEATLINNTIVNCGRGLRLFDLGRWGPPYRLNPGGGTATVINCIIWDCGTSMTLADSSNTDIADRGSHVTVLYSDIEGGRDGVSVSGQRSTVTWGAGNIDADPLLADPGKVDFHLRSQFGRWDPNGEVWVIDDVTSPCIDAGDPNGLPAFEPYPNGGIVNMGAYGNTLEASKSESGPRHGTIEYIFLPDQSVLVQTGGFAGVHWTYRIEGQFRLTVNFDTGTASLSHVEAVATSDEAPPRTLDPNEAFNMTALAGTVGKDRAIRFVGNAANDSEVVVTLTFDGDGVHLVGETIPPPDSADFFILNLDALAQRKQK